MSNIQRNFVLFDAHDMFCHTDIFVREEEKRMSDVAICHKS